MRQISKKLLIIYTAAGLVFAGCKKDFLDVNSDPNRVTDDNVTAELIFPNAAEACGALSFAGARASSAGAKTTLQFAQNWIGYMSSNGDFARDNTETTYNIDFTFADNLFQTRYSILFDLHQAKIKGLAGGDTAVAAASMVLTAKMFQELVDLFGNIPYSQAFEGAKLTRPAYDNAADIYADLQKVLDTAIQYFQLPISSKFTDATKVVDIVNHGDAEKWIKFANTLKLRLLIRQAEVPGFDPTAEITKIFDPAGLGILGAGESVSINPGYVNDVNKQSPFFANYGYTPTGAIAISSTNANQYILDIMNNDSDPRIGQFFAPVGSSFVGNAYGDEPGNLNPGNQSSYFGPTLIGSASQDQWLMPSYESLFFRAEAAARGWISEDPQADYEAAVTESFVWTGLDASDAATYLTNTDADWANSGATTEEKVKFILFQKYIANTGVDPAESYADERRIDFLPPGYISLNPSRVSNTLPVRLLYPQSEYTTNADNVNKQGTINQFTSKLFWQP